MKRLLLSICVVLLSPMLQAQVAPEPALDSSVPVVEARKYSVEIIIFSYNVDDSVGSEIFVPERIEDDILEGPVFDDSSILPMPEEDTVLDEVPDMEIERLPDSEFAMTETWGRLTRLQAYEPLMHFGWIQSTIPDVETLPIPLARLAAPPAGLDGTLSLTLSRFLHLSVELSLAATESERPAQPGYPEEVRERDSYRYAPLRYDISEKRIVKSGEIRYFDHPKFGVIARVDRIVEPQ